MLTSMTGFARKEAESATGKLTCEIRSVNHRYLDVQFRLPDPLRTKELELKQLVGQTMRRGKVDCSLHLRRAFDGEGQVNEALVTRLRDQVTRVQALIPNAGNLDPVDILRWPGVVEEEEVDAEPLYAAATELLTATLASIADMRASEGQRIAAMIDTRCEEVLKIAASVRERIPNVLTALREKQLERIGRLDIEADPARLETELALIAQKLDVHEELDRLDSHVSEIRKVLAGNEPAGRRLDFLMQELNREANTLGSKSADSETTKAAVDLKVLIEQMREQIQNVE